MNILTTDDIHKASLEAGMQEHYMGFHSGFERFARALEKKFLAKLGSAELPEPFGLFCGVRNDPPKTKEFWGMLNEGADGGVKCNLYTAEQLTAFGNARFVQGAASQLSSEPEFFYRPTCNGEMYEGPHHAKSVGGRMLREEKPNEWVALFTLKDKTP